MHPATLRDRLLQRSHPKLICTDQTDLVLEGFPRSGNSFLAWMLEVLDADQRYHIAHHTHAVENLHLAAHYKVPAAVLVRAPEDAILSYMIYSGHDVTEAADRWVAFYASVLGFSRPHLILTFEQVTTDINTAVARLNAHAGLDIPLSRDIAGDTARVHALEQAQADAIHAGRIEEKIAIPSAAREEIKAARRAEVTAHLGHRPEVARIYDRVLEKCLT